LAKRRTFGNTPWGTYFIEKLNAGNDPGRLQRGRTYVNTGRVQGLQIAGRLVTAKVKGSYQPWYKVKIEFPAFSSKERQAVLNLVQNDAVFQAALGLGELPESLIAQLAQSGVELLPHDWSSLDKACNCPDFEDPCKHLAAVYYALAGEVDQNPKVLFDLRGLDLAAEISQFRVEIPPVFQRRPRTQPFEPPGEEPEFGVVGSYLNLVLALLKEAPPFADRGNFKLSLAEFYHKSIRNCDEILLGGPSVVPWGKRGALGENWLAESTLTLARHAGLETTAVRGELKLEVQHPLLGELNVELLELASAFLGSEESAGNAVYRFFFYLFRFFYQLVRAVAFIPAVWVEPALLITWKPLSSIADVEAGISALAAYAPPLLENLPGLKKNEALQRDGTSTVEFFLIALLTAYVHRVGSRGASPSVEDPIAQMFFRGGEIDASKNPFRSTPQSIAGWLAVLEPKPNRLRLELKLTKTSYLLKAELYESQQDSWLPLNEASRRPDAVQALSVVLMLANYLPELHELQTSASVRLSDERLLEFLSESAGVLQHLGVEVRLPKALSRELRPRLTVQAQVKGGGNLTSYLALDDVLDYKWCVEVGGEILDHDQVLELLKESRRLVRFKEGYVLLDPVEMRRLLERAALPVSRMDVVTAYLDASPAFSADARKVFEQLFRDKQTPVPSTLNAELRPYQLQGFRWIWNNLQNGFGCLLADDMGLGKTLQAIAVLLLAKNEGRLAEGALVVVPASLLVNWQRELARFAPELSVALYYGRGRTLTGADVTLSSYETVVRDQPKLAEKSFSLLILDEAHGLKNAATKRALAVRGLRKSSILALSGTPVENRLEDLRALFDLILPGYLGDAAIFRKLWRLPIELNRDAETAQRLRQITAPFLLRRLKADPSIAPDLPPKTVTDEYAVLTASQSALYRTVLEELVPGPEVFSKPRARQAVLLKLLTALKQICNHPRAYDHTSPLKADLSGKTLLLLDILRNVLDAREKVLIFSQYVGTLEILQSLIETEIGEPCLVLHGAQSQAQRNLAVDRFQNDPAQKIFLVSLKAGGVGLNLTSASRVVHYDLWYNPAVENQASDRAFRIGQNRHVFVHRLIATGTFEEKIDAMIKSKRELVDLSVATGESWLSDLSSDDLFKLFQV
jgi:superfamily II DNA or RNA helicase